MPDREKLRALRERIEGGETGREIESEIMRATGHTVRKSRGPQGDVWTYDEGSGCALVMRFTTSLDAAVALVERMLPHGEGWRWEVYGIGYAYVIRNKAPRGTYLGESSTLPTAALVAAFLKALEARDGD